MKIITMIKYIISSTSSIIHYIIIHL